MCTRGFSVIFWLILVVPQLRAATIWDGPTITYSQPSPDPSQPENQDPLTPNVSITRAATAGIFNGVTESAYSKPASPADTEWAVGTLNHATDGSLTYGTWLDAGGGRPVITLVGKQLVLHLISDDIYLSVQFTALGGGGTGGFAYVRSTPAVVAPPTPVVSITNPASGAVFAAPAMVKIKTTATVSGGTVTNVTFLNGTNPLGSAQSAPFSLTTSGLTAGTYGLQAVATAAGVSSTSAVVNISVVNPVAVSSSKTGVTNGQFSFSYTANPGLAYVVQNSSNLVNWQSLATNVAGAALVHVSDNVSNGLRFYRVGRLPNP